MNLGHFQDYYVITWTRWTACRPFCCSGFVASHGATASLGRPLQKNKILSLLFYFHSFWNKDIQGFNLYDLSLSSATFFSIFGISPFFIDLLSKTSCQNVQNPSIFSVNCSFADSHSQGNAEIFFYSQSKFQNFFAIFIVIQIFFTIHYFPFLNFLTIFSQCFFPNLLFFRLQK